MAISGKRPQRAAWFEMAEAASVGIEMAVAIAIGYFGGRWLETHVTHWAPYTRWIGLAFGLGAAVMAVVRTVVVFRRKLEEGEVNLPGGDDPAAPGEPGEPGDAARGPADDA